MRIECIPNNPQVYIVGFEEQGDNISYEARLAVRALDRHYDVIREMASAVPIFTELNEGITDELDRELELLDLDAAEGRIDDAPDSVTASIRMDYDELTYFRLALGWSIFTLGSQQQNHPEIIDLKAMRNDLNSVINS